MTVALVNSILDRVDRDEVGIVKAADELEAAFTKMEYMCEMQIHPRQGSTP